MSARPAVVVTGVGALIGQGIAAGLGQDGRAEIIGLDRRRSLVAETLCDETVQKPGCDEEDAEYLAFWDALIIEAGVRLIIPGISVDMVFLMSHAPFFWDRGVVLALNDMDLIRLSEDKRAFARDYTALGLPQIPTLCDPGSWSALAGPLGPPPYLMKPAVGEGSQGLHILRDEADFAYWSQKTGGAQLYQTIIGTDDEEYTVGVFGLGDGTSLGPLIFRRTLTRSGHTGTAEVVDHPAIAEATARIVAHYRPIGPTNLQFRVAQGKPYLLEINPRFSSSASLRTGFGFNEAAMCLDFYLMGKMPGLPTLRRGHAQRHIADMFDHAGPSE